MNDDERGPPLARRAVLGAATGILAGPLAAIGLAQAQTAPLVSPNPIAARIPLGPLRVSLRDFCTPPASSATRPLAMLNYLFHANDGSGRVFAADSRGKIWSIDGSGTASLFLDIAAVRRGKIFYDGSPKHLGVRSFAFHPDFADSTRPGFRRLYTVNTEIPDTPAGVPILEGPGTPLDFHDVIAEWRVSATNANQVDPSSRREVLRIRQYHPRHNTDQLLFKHSLKPGAGTYGLMYISVGDGINSPTHTDPYDQAQNKKSPLGKILRINPLQRGTRTYTVPRSNPFSTNPDYLPEIWALGLRHPEFLCFDPAGKGQMLIGEIGQAHIESVCIGRPGANYGWPQREGTFATDRFAEKNLFALPANDASFGYTYPVAQYDHSDGPAICGGFVYRGTAIPALVGHYVFGDIVNGRVFSVPISALRLGAQAQIQEVTLLRNGNTVTLRGLLGTSGRVDLRFGQDQAGEMYVMTKQDGIIRKLGPA